MSDDFVRLAATFAAGALTCFAAGALMRPKTVSSDAEEEVVTASMGDMASSLAQGAHKMVLCVRTDLKMGKGKMCAQCGHATLGAYQDSLHSNPSAVKVWEHIGQAKIALKVSGEEELLSLRVAARKAGLVAHLVRDAGHTQIAAGSATVLGIGPAPVDVVDSVTSHLKLL